jgi:hypothetical protein
MVAQSQDKALVKGKVPSEEGLLKRSRVKSWKAGMMERWNDGKVEGWKGGMRESLNR